MVRTLKFFEAIREAQDLCMAKDPSVYIMGLGVPDPKGIFGTTAGLQEKYGPNRVFDIPLSENAITGVGIGSALVGMRPIITHQRVDFALAAMEQMVNQAAKWHYMFGGRSRVPLVIRMVIGRGWGQGPQHSQSLQAWFAHIPGLKVVMPATPHDAKGLLISSIEDDNPVIFLEHRWLHGLSDHVPEGLYRVPIGSARIVREGADVTIAAVSYMTLESLRAADALLTFGISAEVIDLRSLRPLDEQAIVSSVRKTGRLVVADTGAVAFGAGAEVCALAVEGAFGALKSAPVRIGLPPYPTPTTPALADNYFPRSGHIADAICGMFGKRTDLVKSVATEGARLDQPDLTFVGPF